MPLGQFDERIITQANATLNSTSTPNTYTDLIGAANQDTRWDTIGFTNSDTIEHNVAVAFGTSDDFLICEVPVPAGAGHGSVPVVDWLAAAFPAAYHYFLTGQGVALSWTVREAIGAGKFITGFCAGGTV